jgi:hypothetical protein
MITIYNLIKIKYNLMNSNLFLDIIDDDGLIYKLLYLIKPLNMDS